MNAVEEPKTLAEAWSIDASQMALLRRNGVAAESRGKHDLAADIFEVLALLEGFEGEGLTDLARVEEARGRVERAEAIREVASWFK